MRTKEELSLELTVRLNELFVDDYEKVNSAKDDVNEYLDSINITSKYDYNEFCNDFLKVSKKLIQSLTLADMDNVDPGYIMGEIMTVMVKFKIIESEPDETVRLQKLIQHELRTNIARGGLDSTDS